jgi:hypothetical protein
MSFTIDWADIPLTPRKNFCDKYVRPYTDLSVFRAELVKFHCEYTSDYLAIFESEAYYTWFVLRWS